MRATITIYTTDRDNNSCRWSYHTAAIVDTAGLLDKMQIIADTIAAISDARITRIMYTIRHVVRLLDRPVAGPGRIERSGLFITTAANGSIYTMIVPAIKDTQITTAGTLAGVLLTDDAINVASSLINTLPVLNDELSTINLPFITGSVVS